MPTSTDDEDDRHRCEVENLMRRYPDNVAVGRYLNLVETKRGFEAAKRLRADLLIAWRERQRREALRRENFFEFAGQA